MERRSLDLASSHSSDEEDSSRSRHRSRRNVGVSTSAAAPQVSTTPSYLPDIMEDIMVSSSSNLPGARLASIEPPEHLNVIANSQLFPNLKPNYYSPRWNRQRVDPCNTGKSKNLLSSLSTFIFLLFFVKNYSLYINK